MKIIQLKDEIIRSLNIRFAKAFRKFFPKLRIIVATLNGFIGLSGGLTVLTAIFVYMIPKFHLFFDSMRHIFSVHSIFASLVLIGVIMTVISIAGLYFLYKNEYENLGIQGVSFLLLLIVMVAIVFSFWHEWEENALFAMSYATQSYSPLKIESKYFESIQESLHCCGSQGPSDFDIGNEYFHMKTAPISCCNFADNPDICSEKKKSNHTGMHSLSIPVKLAYKVGCIDKMENIIWPAIVGIISCEMLLALCCMIITSILCVGYDSYMAKSSKIDTDSKKTQLLAVPKSTDKNINCEVLE